MNEHMQAILNRIRELWFVPFLVHAFGFIFVQGLFAPYDGNLFILQPFLQTTPTSYAMYVLNGIYVFFVVGTGAALAYVGLTWIPGSVFQRMRANGLVFYYLAELFGAALCALVFVMQLLWVKYGLTFPAIPPFFLYILFYFLFSIPVILLWRLTYSRHRPRSLMRNMLMSVFVAFLLVLSLFQYGLHVKIIQTTQIVRNGEKLHVARVTVGDSPTRSYIQMDLTSNYFIGYDQVGRKVVHIPREQITSLETYRVAQSGVREKYRDSPSPDGSNEQRVARVVQQFYEAVTSKGESLEPLEQLRHLVRNPLRAQLGLGTDPSILQRYAQDGTLYGFGHASFYGVELAIPDLVEQDGKELFHVLVKEHWKEGVRSYRYTLKPEGDPPAQWTITGREEAVFQFE